MDEPAHPPPQDKLAIARRRTGYLTVYGLDDIARHSTLEAAAAEAASCDTATGGNRAEQVRAAWEAAEALARSDIRVEQLLAALHQQAHQLGRLLQAPSGVSHLDITVNLTDPALEVAQLTGLGRSVLLGQLAAAAHDPVHGGI
ncbi:hypothetical protein ACQEVF_57480 [Nonomuraea polychroma]|uniref:hypothetical protein n=1 Tax=Nonomuraea polychroma TaxID=46176 RepID=UPI003D91B27E